MKKIIICIILLAVFISGGLWLKSRTATRQMTNMYNELSKIADNSVDFSSIFNEINNMRSSWNGVPILCTDKWYQAKCANILVLDLKKKGAIKDKEYERLIENLANNAIAFPPNVILIDRALISNLVAESYILMLTSTKTMLASEKTIGEQPFNITTAFTLASAAAYEVYDSGFIPLPEGGSSIDNTATSLLNINDKGDNAIVNKTIFEESLAFLIEHELAHLQSKNGIYGFNSLGSSTESVGSIMTLKEENRADNMALKSMEKYIEHQRKSTNTTIARWYSDPFLSALPFLVQAEYYRNKALWSGLQGFRKLSSTDLSLEFVHQECDFDNPEYIDFLDPDTLWAARRKPLPVLTADEWESRRVQMAKTDRPLTHQHDLERAENIYDALSKSRTELKSLLLKDHITYIKALINNKPLEAFKDVEGFIEMPETNLDEFLNNTENDVHYKSAVTCPLERCYVGKIQGDDGYIEVIGSKSKLAELRIIMNLGNPETKNTKELDKYYINMVRYMHILMVATPSFNNLVSTAAALRMGMFKCGAAGGLIVNNSNTIAFHATTMQKKGYLQIRIFNSKVMDIK